MDISNLLDDIIDNIQPEDVPSAFITMAKITDINGFETIIRGSELDSFLKNPKVDIIEIRFVLDVRKIKLAILHEAKTFFQNVDEKVKKNIL